METDPYQGYTDEQLQTKIAHLALHIATLEVQIDIERGNQEELLGLLTSRLISNSNNSDSTENTDC